MEIESFDTNLLDYIVELDEVLDPQICKDIIDEYQQSNLWQSGVIGGKGEIDKLTRNCDAIHISDEEVIKGNEEKRREIDKVMFDAVSKCLTYYNGMFWSLKVSNDTGYELLRYKEGGFYIEHIDHFKEYQRTLTMSLILNDNYEGGEFSFFNKEYIVKPRAGQAILFPSNFMFPHGVLPVKNGTRYAVVTWFL